MAGRSWRIISRPTSAELAEVASFIASHPMIDGEKIRRAVYVRSTMAGTITPSVLNSLTSSVSKASDYTASMVIEFERSAELATAFHEVFDSVPKAIPNTSLHHVEKPYGRDYRSKTGKNFGKRNRF